MAKKRKESTQSNTLLNFFGAGTAAAGSTPKRPRLSQGITPRNKVKKHNAAAVPVGDIIVIDDSDDDVPSSPVDDGKVKAYTPASSQSVPGPSTRSGQELAAVQKQESPAFDVGDASRLSEQPEQPVLFEQAATQVAACEEQVGGDFGEPTLLYPDSPTTVEAPLSGKLDCSSPVILQAQGTTTTLEPVSELAAATEEWGTGDDEVDIANEETTFFADDEVPVTAVPSEEHTAIDENAERCPICEVTLPGMSPVAIQEHVNACIDDATTEVSPTPLASESSKCKLLPPPSAQKPEAMKASIEGLGAFSVLMTSHKENEAWKEAAVAEDRNFRPTKSNGGRRKAPFYKVLQGMPIAVDAFRYGSIPSVTAYFLTHAHSDHYTNLSSNWKSGPIYCSEGTANLIMLMLGVDAKWVHPLPFNVATVIPDTGGVRVTPIEANHCPGSCLFLFEGQQTVNAGDSAYKSPFVGSKTTFRYLHCGDFRASPQHVNHPAILGKHIDHVYLDTTYLHPKYCFPPQSQVITACAELARRLVAGESVHGDGSKQDGKVDAWFSVQSKAKDPEKASGGRILVVVGTYSIGKERIVKAIAKALQTKVYSDPRKTAILRCQADPELDALLTSDPLDAGVHLLPLGTIASDKLKIYLERWKGHFDRAIGFRPTGWTFTAPSGTETLPTIPTVISRSQSKSFSHTHFNPMKNSTPTLQLYGVPYSEHSSFFELTCFALSLDWGRMIATVNVGSEASRGKMSKWVERWDAERKKRGKTQIVPPRAADYW